MNFKRIENQRGVALIAVLGVSVILSLLVAGATILMEKQLELAENAKAQFIEKAATYKKSQELAYFIATQRITKAGISTGKNKTGANKVDGRFTATFTGDEVRVDGFLYEGAVDGTQVSYSIQAADGLIPVNTSNDFWLKKWLASYGVVGFNASKFTDRLADYADEDTWARPAGAEERSYGTAPPPTNFLFQKCSEIYNVIGLKDIVDERNIDLNECSLNRSASVNINAMPLSLIKKLFKSKGESIYSARVQGSWLDSSSQVQNSIGALNAVASDYVSIISKGDFIIRVTSPRNEVTIIVKRGIRKLMPAEVRRF